MSTEYIFLGIIELLTFFAALIFLYPRICEPFSIKSLSYNKDPKTLNLKVGNRHRKHYEVKPRITLKVDKNFQRVIESEEPISISPKQTKDIKFQTEVSDKEFLSDAEICLEHKMESQNFSRKMKRYVSVDFSKETTAEEVQATRTQILEVKETAKKTPEEPTKFKKQAKKASYLKNTIDIDKKYNREKEFLSVTLFVRNKGEKTANVEVRDFLPKDAADVEVLSGKRKNIEDKNIIAWHFDELKENELRILHYKFKSNASSLHDAEALF